MSDLDADLGAAIHATTEELEAARAVVQTLANELADVIEVIEPALADHTKRLRQARMASLDEMRQITTHLQELRKLLTSSETEHMLRQGERFLALCRELEEFRAVGFLDAYVRLLAGPAESR
jgi:negative regulator of replication initiation